MAVNSPDSAGDSDHEQDYGCNCKQCERSHGDRWQPHCELMNSETNAGAPDERLLCRVAIRELKEAVVAGSGAKTPSVLVGAERRAVYGINPLRAAGSCEQNKRSSNDE